MLPPVVDAAFLPAPMSHLCSLLEIRKSLLQCSAVFCVCFTSILVLLSWTEIIGEKLQIREGAAWCSERRLGLSMALHGSSSGLGKGDRQGSLGPHCSGGDWNQPGKQRRTEDGCFRAQEWWSLKQGTGGSGWERALMERPGCREGKTAGETETGSGTGKEYPGSGPLGEGLMFSEHVGMGWDKFQKKVNDRSVREGKVHWGAGGQWTSAGGWYRMGKEQCQTLSLTSAGCSAWVRSTILFVQQRGAMWAEMWLGEGVKDGMGPSQTQSNLSSRTGNKWKFWFLPLCLATVLHMPCSSYFLTGQQSAFGSSDLYNTGRSSALWL